MPPLIINPNKGPVGPAVPTVAEVEQGLNLILNTLMTMFRNHNVQGFTINSVGKVLAAMKFEDGERQSPAEIKLLIRKVAEEEVESIRVWLLKQSVDTSNPTTLN